MPDSIFDIEPCWKDRYLRTSDQAIINDDTSSCNSVDLPPDNSDITVLWKINADAINKLIACVLQGSIVIYPDEVNAIYWSLIKGLECYMDICQEVVNCINTNGEVRNSIQNAVTGLVDAPGQPGRWQQQAVDAVPGCDKDQTFGYVKALWDYLNQSNKDFLQQVAEATNQYETFEAIFSAIPIFSELPLDEFYGWVARLGDYNLEAYNASVTDPVNDKIYCDLFCIAVNNNCSITFEQTWNYFEEQFGGANFPTLGATFLELVEFMITGNYPGDRIVYLWTLVQLGVSFIGAQWLGRTNMQRIRLHAQAGDPSADWQLLCSPCIVETTIVVTFDSTGYLLYAFIIGQPAPTFGLPAPSGQAAYNAAITTWQCVVEVDLQAEYTVTATSMNWFRPATSGSDVAIGMQYLDSNQTVLQSNIVTSLNSDVWQSHADSITSIANVQYVRFVIAKTTATNQQLYIDNLSVTYQ